MNELSELGGRKFVLNIDEGRSPEAAAQPLTEADRRLIKAFDFKLSADLTYLDYIFSELNKNIHNEVVKKELEVMKLYLLNQAGRMIDVVDNLQQSSNPELQKLVEPLQGVCSQLASLGGQIDILLRDFVPDTLVDTKAFLTETRNKLLQSSGLIKHNPAYRAYRTYVEQNDLEGVRVGFSSYRQEQQQQQSSV